MSEYLFVEKPFLDHLSSLGWEVIDQGCGDPAARVFGPRRCEGNEEREARRLCISQAIVRADLRAGR